MSLCIPALSFGVTVTSPTTCFPDELYKVIIRQFCVYSLLHCLQVALVACYVFMVS